ncbi:hypothetical protein ABEF93_005176 [Exophiala dermatitidis]
MSNRRDRVDGFEQSKSRVRIGRACDRCKLKKSKCDGNTPCSSCVASDSPCEYSVRRRREARDWYWGMQDIIDEALQRLYWACRQGRGFPGVVPDETNGRVSTDAILRGLGLSPPPVDRLGLGTTQSDSALDGVERQAERSYRPPDIQTDRLSRPSTSSSRPTPIPIVSDDRSILGDGVQGMEGQGLSAQRMPVHNQPSRDSTNLPQPFPETVEGTIDPGMLQDGDMDMINLDRAMYSDVDAMQFEPAERLAGHGEQTPAQIGHNTLRPQPSQDGAIPGHDSGWHGQRGFQATGPLPWPGTLAAVYRNDQSKPDGHSFQGQGGQQ